MKTMIAKYNGVCSHCGETIIRGERICFFGYKLAEHESCTQARQEDEESNGYCEDERAGFEPGTLANDRRLAKRGLSVVRFSSGHVMTQNSRGRCEDAPCCGCCS